MARGVDAPSLGNFRSRVLIRGMEIERSITAASVTTLVAAMRYGKADTQEVNNAYKNLMDSYDKIMCLDTFTESFDKPADKGRSKDMDLLTKLGGIN